MNTKRILNIISSFMAGAILSSLWITGSETWKYYLPIFLFCVVIIQAIDITNEENK